MCASNKNALEISLTERTTDETETVVNIINIRNYVYTEPVCSNMQLFILPIYNVVCFSIYFLVQSPMINTEIYFNFKSGFI